MAQLLIDGSMVSNVSTATIMIVIAALECHWFDGTVHYWYEPDLANANIVLQYDREEMEEMDRRMDILRDQ